MGSSHPTYNSNNNPCATKTVLTASPDAALVNTVGNNTIDTIVSGTKTKKGYKTLSYPQHEEWDNHGSIIGNTHAYCKAMY